jgi:hypothetical protein
MITDWYIFPKTQKYEGVNFLSLTDEKQKEFTTHFTEQLVDNAIPCCWLYSLNDQNLNPTIFDIHTKILEYFKRCDNQVLLAPDSTRKICGLLANLRESRKNELVSQSLLEEFFQQYPYYTAFIAYYS